MKLRSDSDQIVKGLTLTRLRLKSINANEYPCQPVQRVDGQLAYGRQSTPRTRSDRNDTVWPIRQRRQHSCQAGVVISAHLARISRAVGRLQTAGRGYSRHDPDDYPAPAGPVGRQIDAPHLEHCWLPFAARA